MLMIYEAKTGGPCRKRANPGPLSTVWIDLLNPTREEEGKFKRALKLEEPTPKQHEIEASAGSIRRTARTT